MNFCDSYPRCRFVGIQRTAPHPAVHPDSSFTIIKATYKRESERTYTVMPIARFFYYSFLSGKGYSTLKDNEQLLLQQAMNLYSKPAELQRALWEQTKEQSEVVTKQAQ